MFLSNSLKFGICTYHINPTPQLDFPHCRSWVIVVKSSLSQNRMDYRYDANLTPTRCLCSATPEKCLNNTSAELIKLIPINNCIQICALIQSI